MMMLKSTLFTMVVKAISTGLMIMSPVPMPRQ